jgi:hypothetical protein
MRRTFHAYRSSFQSGSAAVEFIVIAALWILLIVQLLGAARGLYARLGLLTVAADCATAQMHRQDLGFAMQTADEVAAAYGLAGMYNSFPVSRMGCFAISGSSPTDPWGTFSYQIHMPYQRYQSDWEAGQ